jgi:hypothetical protein
MTKYYARWTMNPLAAPKSPEEMMKQLPSMLEMVKADMKAGIIKDWGLTSDLSEGYTIVECANEVEYAATTLKWIAALNISAKPVLTVDQTMEAFQKSMASMKR